jgi:hypothetical protein
MDNGTAAWKGSAVIGALSAGTSVIKLTNPTVDTVIFDSGSTGSHLYSSVWFADPQAVILTGNNNTISVLKFSAGSDYEFSAGSTLQVLNIDWEGTISDPITIHSDSPGTQFHLTGISGSRTAYYVDITDSEVSGGAIFTAINSIDSGNNDGWNFATTGGNSLFFGTNH